MMFQRNSRKNNKTFTYFIACPAARSVKVGLSVNPRHRVLSLQIGCPLRLKVLAFFPGGYEDETYFQDEFSDFRLHGEWFGFSEKIKSMILALSETRPTEKDFLDAELLKSMKFHPRFAQLVEGI
jgi:hypothetical protein